MTEGGDVRFVRAASLVCDRSARPTGYGPFTSAPTGELAIQQLGRREQPPTALAIHWTIEDEHRSGFDFIILVSRANRLRPVLGLWCSSLGIIAAWSRSNCKRHKPVCCSDHASQNVSAGITGSGIGGRDVLC